MTKIYHIDAESLSGKHEDDLIKTLCGRLVNVLDSREPSMYKELVGKTVYEYCDTCVFLLFQKEAEEV